MRLTRILYKQSPSWGLVSGDQIELLTTDSKQTAQILTHDVSTLPKSGETIAVDDAEFLSPVTPPSNVICQGKNYAEHRVETGADPEKPNFNLIFSKSDTSITGSAAEIPIPESVQLLDYEIELGLVIGKPVTPQSKITEANWHEFIAGLVIANDISARDIQLSQGQWFKGKSFPKFCPVGPYLQCLDDSNIKKFHDLNLSLSVNGEVRQHASTRDMLFKPFETLNELKDIMTLNPGDLLLTGTPGGVALAVPSPLKQRLGAIFFSEQKRMEIFIKSQLNNQKYLKPGDKVSATITSGDGGIDLGTQNLTIV